MSTPYVSASPGSAAVPATREFSAAWIAYVAYAASSILLWPALIGLIINYSKRGQPDTGFIDSHHRWMLRSFWWSQLWCALFFVVILIGLWPLIADVVGQAVNAGDWSGGNGRININWSSIFSTVGAATLGSLGFAVTWFWFVYRIVRGMIVLADARPMP